MTSNGTITQPSRGRLGGLRTSIEEAAALGQSALQRVAAGEMGAFKECIDEYGGLVWSLARRFCPTPTEAEDAVQDVFLALWENASRFDPAKGEEATFVALIARRRIIDRGRRRGRREARLEQYRTLKESMPPEDVDLASRSDEAALAMKAMKQLSQDQQRVLNLSIHHGLTHEQIARATDLPLGTVKTHARRGLKRVRELLQRERGVAEGEGEAAS